LILLSKRHRIDFHRGAKFYVKKFLLAVFFILIILKSAFPAANQMSVYFLDVGQGDCEVLLNGNHVVIIDTAIEEMAPRIVSFLKSKNILTIDLLILTHPHADHIGSATEVLSSFTVSNIYMPKVTANTRIFERLVGALKAQGKTAHAPIPGESLSIGEMTLDFLAPYKIDTENLNNDSIVCKLTFGSVKVLFMGDAEKPEEKDIRDHGSDLRANVLKVAHHGSNSSTTDAFLKKVDPLYAVIEVALHNDYGHPSVKTVNRLEKTHGIKVFQTALNGTIEMRTDGKTIQFFMRRSNT
jgi:competence protein ComEC